MGYPTLALLLTSSSKSSVYIESFFNCCLSIAKLMAHIISGSSSQVIMPEVLAFTAQDSWMKLFATQINSSKRLSRSTLRGHSASKASVSSTSDNGFWSIHGSHLTSASSSQPTWRSVATLLTWSRSTMFTDTLVTTQSKRRTVIKKSLWCLQHSSRLSCVLQSQSSLTSPGPSTCFQRLTMWCGALWRASRRTLSRN